MAFRDDTYTVDVPHRARLQWSDNSPERHLLPEVRRKDLLLLRRRRQISKCRREGVRAIEADSESVAQSVRDVASKHPIGMFAMCLSPRDHLEWGTDFPERWVTGPVGGPAPVERQQLPGVLVATCKR